MADVTSMTMTELRDAIRAKKLSSREAIGACLDAIAALDPQIRAFVSTDRERALVAAAKADERVAAGETAPLLGVPIAVKDNMCVRNGRTTCSSRMLENFRPPYDAHVVEQLEAAGAVIVGKTNLDEFAMGSTCENSAFFVTGNPWDLEHVTGGSSGGSAAAVATRMVPAALGSDTGGSIRQPAAFCGVCGLKPTYGRVSRYGLVAYGSSLDQIGPITQDVRDAALLLRVIGGHDGRDSTSVERPVPDYVAELGGANGAFRVGVPVEYFQEGLDDEVRTAVQAAIDVFRQQGATIVDLHLPHAPYCVACYYLIVTAEASSNLARYDGVHYGHRTASPEDYVDLYCASRQEGLGAEVRRRIMLGTYALSSGYYDAYYLKALKVRTLIRRDFETAFGQCDVIAGPIAPSPAFRMGELVDDPLAMYLADIYTVPANLAGHAGISIPCGFSRSGLPIGLQLMVPPFAEAPLLRAALAYQQATDWHTRVPPHRAGAVASS